jgi:thymidylate synthase (FAD)
MIECVKVLDHGSVDLVDVMGDDLTVVNAARVSFNKESDWDADYKWTGVPIDKRLQDRDEKLIHYLAKHKHWTPFAHPQITLRIKAPIFVRTQLFKHKVGFTENEVSRRYVTDEPCFYSPIWRSAPEKSMKQGSGGPMPIDDSYNTCTRIYAMSLKEALHTYNELIKNGVAPEQARSILPQSTYTEWWWTGSLAAYARVYHQRADSHAQWEVQQYAAAIGIIIKQYFPSSWKALVNDEKAGINRQADNNITINQT